MQIYKQKKSYINYIFLAGTLAFSSNFTEQFKKLMRSLKMLSNANKHLRLPIGGRKTQGLGCVGRRIDR